MYFASNFLKFGFELFLLQFIIYYLIQFNSYTNFENMKTILIIILINVTCFEKFDFQFTPVTHMVYLEIQLHEVNFLMAKSK